MKCDLHLQVFKLFDSDNSGKMDVTEMVDVRAPEWTGQDTVTKSLMQHQAGESQLCQCSAFKKARPHSLRVFLHLTRTH